MRLLANIIRQIWRRNHLTHVDQIDEGALHLRVLSLEQNFDPPETPVEALEYLREEVLPLLEDINESGDIALAGRLEAWAYARLIKTFELPEHYHNCFSLIDKPLRDLGRKAASANSNSISMLPDAWHPCRWVFFVHNLASDLAHSRLLCDLLRTYLLENPHVASNIRIAGLADQAIAPCFQSLHEEFNVKIITYPLRMGLYPALQALAHEVNEHYDERCIVVSVPIGLSFMSELVHAERLAWLSMKFELSAFSNLLHRFSFTTGCRAVKRLDESVWWSAPPLFAVEPVVKNGIPLTHAERIERYQTVFFTINREEKIRNPLYLEAVSRILHALPDTCFVWTGRVALPEVETWFRKHGLGDRCFYVGWVDPDGLLSRGHIFLDTPVLSGSIAAKSMLCGIPVITFQGSRSWVNFFKPVLDKEITTIDDSHPLQPVRRLMEHGLHLECADLEQYIKQAVALACNNDLRKLYSTGMRAYGEYYFLNKYAYARMHFENFTVTRADHVYAQPEGLKFL